MKKISTVKDPKIGSKKKKVGLGKILLPEKFTDFSQRILTEAFQNQQYEQ